MSILYGGEDYIERRQQEIDDFNELVDLVTAHPVHNPVDSRWEETPIYDALCVELDDEPIGD